MFSKQRTYEVPRPIFGPQKVQVFVCLDCGAEYHMNRHWDKRMDKTPTECLECRTATKEKV